MSKLVKDLVTKELTSRLKELASLPNEEKSAAGAALNQMKSAFESAFAARRSELAETARVGELRHRGEVGGSPRSQPVQSGVLGRPVLD